MAKEYRHDPQRDYFAAEGMASSFFKELSEEDKTKESIEEITPALLSLAEGLSEQLKHGHYDFIIGDDGSGRLPTLFVNELAQLEQDRSGTPKPPLAFVKVDRFDDNYDSVRVYLRELLSGHRVKRLLFVTDLVMSNDTVQRFVESLPSGIEVDLATLRITEAEPDAPEEYYDSYSSEARKDEKTKILNRIGYSRVYIGEIGDVPTLYNFKQGSGVETAYNNSDQVQATTKRSSRYSSYAVRTSRRLIRELAKKGFDKYF